MIVRNFHGRDFLGTLLERMRIISRILIAVLIMYYDVTFLIIDISDTLPDFIDFSSSIFHSNAHSWSHFLRCERNFSALF